MRGDRRQSNRLVLAVRSPARRVAVKLRMRRAEHGRWTEVDSVEQVPSALSAPPSSDKNMIRSNHVDLPRYSISVVRQSAAFTHGEL